MADEEEKKTENYMSAKLEKRRNEQFVEIDFLQSLCVCRVVLSHIRDATVNRVRLKNLLR